MLYIDAEDAFDKVPHDRLLHKLQPSGVGGSPTRGFRDWLRRRDAELLLVTGLVTLSFYLSQGPGPFFIIHNWPRN